MMLVLAAYDGWSVRFSDVSRAFLHIPIKEPVFAVPTVEDPSPIPDSVWEMTKTVYGLEEAPADFDEHFGTVAKNLCDEVGTLNLVRLTTEPAAFWSKLSRVMMCQHMDDGVLVGPDGALDRTLAAMGKLLLLKTSSGKLFDSLMTSAGLQNCAAVYSPGVRSEMRVPNGEPKLSPAEHKQYRTIVGKLMFLASERPDIQYGVKECAPGVQNPSAPDMQRAKRIWRYLMGTRDWTMKLEPWKDVDTLQMFVDSDWATDKVNRRSTSAGIAQFGGCTILSYSRTQGSPALSSAEAEGYAFGSGACEGFFICAVARELNINLKLALHSDSTATISQHSKLGLGRMKHVELRFLFVLLKRGRLSLCKVLGKENPADIGTRVLDVTTHRYLCSIVGLEPVKQAVEEIKGNQKEWAIFWKCGIAKMFGKA